MSHIYIDQVHILFPHRLFFPNTEFIAFAPIFIPHLARFPIKLPLVCAFFFCLCLLYFFTFFLAIFCVAEGAKLTVFFLTTLFLGPIVCVRLIVTFASKYFWLTLSNFVRNDVTLGYGTLRDVTHCPNSMFCLIENIFEYRFSNFTYKWRCCCCRYKNSYGNARTSLSFFLFLFFSYFYH